MNILVTGGAGNLGSRLAVPLVQRGDTVTLFDVHAKPAEPSAEVGQCRMAVGDLAVRAGLFRLLEEGRFDSIFHLAALLSGDAEQDPERAWAVNMDGTRNVLEGARLFGVKRVVFTSTVASFGGGLAEPVAPDAPQWPVSLYGVTKVAGERLGVYYHHRFGLDFRCLRLAAVVAPHGAMGGASRFCSELYREVVGKGEYEFYIEPATRAPMIYVDDAIAALLELHNAPESALSRRVYQVNGIAPSAAEMAAAVLARLPQIEFSYKPDPIRNAIVKSWPLRFDDAASARDWGWRSRFDLEAMTDRMLAALQATK